MALIYGLFGAMSGKVADVVMSVRNGQQIVRKYQPVVSNPKTVNQYTTRARFKLLSQLSAVMAPVIAIPRNGGVSSRNRFTQKNFRLSTFVNDAANITLVDVQLTDSVVAFPQISGNRTSDAISAYIDNAQNLGTIDVNRVIYSMFVKQADNKFRFVTSRVATSAGDGGWGVADFPLVNEEVVIYGYGVRDNNETASLYFGNLETITAAIVAQLVVSRTLTERDITLTETRGFTLSAATMSLSRSKKDKSSEETV